MPEHKSSRGQTLPELPPLMGRGGPGGPRMMGKVEQAKDTRATIARLWSYLSRHKEALIATTLMVIVSTGLNLLGPYLLGLAIDHYIFTGDLAGLARLCLLMIGAFGLASLLTWLQTYVMAGVAQRVVRDIRNDLFIRLQSLSLRFFDQHPHGELMSRLANDVENINNVLTESVTQLIAGVLSLIGVAGVMVWINPRLALVSLLTTP